MSDLISRQVVNTLVDELARAISDERCFMSRGRSTGEIMSDILNLPSVENKGEWIVREDNTSFVKQIPRRWVECSHCGWSFSYDRIHDNFCSKCGARMKGGE